MFRIVRCISVALLALPMAGCWEFELFSWSPDGRYLVLVDESEGQAWRWDTVKRQPAPLPGLDGADIVRFSYASNGEAFVLGSNLQLSGLFAREVDSLVKLDIKGGGLFEVSPSGAIEWFAVSADGRQIATVATVGEGEEARSVVAVAPTHDVNKQRVLVEFKEEVVTWAFDNSGTRLLLTKVLPEEELPEGVEEGTELVLLEFGTDTVATKDFAGSFTDTPIGARFAGDDAFVYNRIREEEDEPIGAIMLQKLDGSEPELLHEPAFGLFPPSVSPDGKSVVFTATNDPSADWDDTILSSNQVQLMMIDLESREKTVITDEAFGAYAGKYHPKENRIAYATGSDPFCAKILDLDTREEQLVWRNDEERIFVTAQRMFETGDSGMTIANLDELLHRFPETKFRSRAAYLRMNVHLKTPLNEFDEAVRAFNEIRVEELRTQARQLLWEKTGAQAADPAGDLIREYQTETSVKEFDHETDGTRDLTDLAVRATPERLYLRVGFDSNYDLGGSVFSDLVLLIHEAGRDGSWRTVTPNVEWEYSPARTIIVRHWFAQGQVYDLEVLDENGGAIARYAGSGFAPPAFPLFDVFDVDDAGKAIACWIDWRTVGLHPGKEYFLQVCTVKGGLETRKGFERPRESDSWDIADAFGDANTKARVDEQIAAGEKPELKGYAVELELPRRDDR